MKLGPFDLNQTHQGDALESLRQLPDACIHCVVTSPPYWGLRSYLEGGDPNKDLELGAEKTPAEYVARMTEVFREVRRVLRDDGTLWLNLGDSYAATGKSGGSASRGQGAKWDACGAQAEGPRGGKWSPAPQGLKPKDLCLMPYRVALGLQADGWYLRSNIVWAKGISFCEGYSGSVMPEGVKDRPTSAHESMFLFAKSTRYYYDLDAIREPNRGSTLTHRGGGRAGGRRESQDDSGLVRSGGFGRWQAPRKANPKGRNTRNVWAIGPERSGGSHYAVFPPALVAPCVKAGCPPGGIVLDPFMGSGTTAQVAQDYGRQWLGFDLDERNLELAARRTRQRSLFTLIAEGSNQ